jgi:DNA (cytosine-5)-methyltransferase 1
MPKIVLIIQARMSSTRLPGKSMMPLAGKPLVYRMVERLKNCRKVDEIVIATSDQPEDQLLIDLAKELQPKVVVAENVKGLLLGNAKQYVRKIYTEFEKAGYYVQHWLLDASKMGVPQRRERVFFIALRKDLAKPFMFQKDMFTEVPKLELEFNEKEIPYKDIKTTGKIERPLSPAYQTAWDNRQKGDLDMSCTMGRVFNRPNSFFNYNYIYDEKVLNTITAGDKNVVFSEPRYLSKKETCSGGTYPQDYNFLKLKTEYLVGMSVPPVMTAQIANNIYEQWLSKL